MADASYRPRYLDSEPHVIPEQEAMKPFRRVRGIAIGHCERGHVNCHPGAECCWYWTEGEGSCNKPLLNFPDEVMTFLTLGEVSTLEELDRMLKQFGWPR